MSVQQPDPDEIQAAALEAWNEGRLGKEFTTKQLDRGLDDATIYQVLKSKSSYIAKYVDNGQPRYGFWNPGTGIFVAWQPAEQEYKSEFKTCIEIGDEDYLRQRRDFQPLRGFDD